MCTSTGTASATLQIDNDRIRVTEWRFPKNGDNTGWHRHEYDYVVVPLFDGTLEIDLGKGERVIAQMQNGIPYYRDLGTAHDVINNNDFECAFVEIELLEPKP